MSEFSFLISALKHWTDHTEKQNALLQEILAEVKSQGEQTRMAISTSEQAILDRFTALVATVKDIAAKLNDLVTNGPADDTEFNAKLSTLAQTLEDAAKPPVTPTTPGGGL